MPIRIPAPNKTRFARDQSYGLANCLNELNKPMSRSKKNKRSGTSNRPNEQLASEYALGILTNDEKSRADALFVNDPSFRLMVEDWQERIAPMMNEAGEVPAPETVWREVEGQLFGEPDTDAPKITGFWSNPVLWRNLSFACLAVIVILIGIVVFRPGGQQTVPADKSGFVAALVLAEGKPTFFVQMDMISGKLNIRSANLTGNDSRVPELWLIRDDGIPLSLGILFANGDTTLNIASSALAGFISGATLAVSLEAAGGAPKGKPTSSFIATGPLQNI